MVVLLVVVLFATCQGGKLNVARSWETPEPADQDDESTIKLEYAHLGLDEDVLLSDIPNQSSPPPISSVADEFEYGNKHDIIPPSEEQLCDLTTSAWCSQDDHTAETASLNSVLSASGLLGGVSAHLLNYKDPVIVVQAAPQQELTPEEIAFAREPQEDPMPMDDRVVISKMFQDDEMDVRDRNAALDIDPAQPFIPISGGKQRRDSPYMENGQSLQTSNERPQNILADPGTFGKLPDGAEASIEPANMCMRGMADSEKKIVIEPYAESHKNLPPFVMGGPTIEVEKDTAPKIDH